ncbi:hypothetical protein H5410_055687 [Solanum commersonii]|uniref:Uncharacterized protein n=1 Tax=Solanum commersonii TaxID=4109 RepID=A0A9J5WI91_SOLCO|nr:hypothetical protein H5410_055687 [Solanum commersonii]
MSIKKVCLSCLDVMLINTLVTHCLCTHVVMLRFVGKMKIESTKKTHGQKSKFVPPENPIDVPDDITVTKKNGKRKRTASKEHVTLSKSVRKSKYTDDSDGDMVVSTKTRKARILAFKKRKVIRGRVVTGIGGHEIGELLLSSSTCWATLFLQEMDM